MKAFTKRGSAVLDAPEEMLAPGASDLPWAPSSASSRSDGAMREPAPAGALQRANASAFQEDLEDEERPYVPVRGKLQFGVGRALRSTTGRIVVAVAGVLTIAVVAVGLFAVRSFLLHDELFVIPASAHIEIQGNSSLTRAQVLSVFGEDVERNIFKVPLAQRRSDLERLPWVDHAIVMRLLPNTLRVSIAERTPVAFVRQGTRIGLIDASGVLLDMPPDAAGNPHYSFPVLTGLSAEDPLPTRASRMDIYKRFMKELDSSGEKITDTLSEVDVSSPEDVKALIPNAGTDILVHFGDEAFLTRYKHFEEHLQEWKQQYPKLASADMRYERQVVLEMAPGAGVPSREAVVPSVPVIAAGPAKPADHVARAPVSVAPKPVAEMPVSTHAPHVAAAKPVPTASGKTSAANARMFAALAAARKQQVENSGQRPQ